MVRAYLLRVYVRSLGDLVVVVTAIVSMHFQGAPAWAMTLALLVATRASLLVTAMDLAALQDSIRKTIDETMPKQPRIPGKPGHQDSGHLPPRYPPPR